MKTKIIILGILSVYVCTISSTSIAYTSKEDKECKKFSGSSKEYGEKELTCAEIEQADKKNAADKQKEVDRQDAECKKFSKESAEYGNKELTCAEIEAADKDIAQEKAEAEEACKKASKEIDGVERDCAGYYAKAEEVRQAECRKPTKEVPEGFKDCEERQAALKNRQGAGFKLNLNSLTVTQGSGKDKQRSGSAIFENKDYAQYGVIVGTLLRVTDILIMLIGSLAMLTLVVAGIFMITNHGDEAWVTKGKTMMLYSILGLLFALLSFAFVSIIQSALA